MKPIAVRLSVIMRLPRSEIAGSRERLFELPPSPGPIAPSSAGAFFSPKRWRVEALFASLQIAQLACRPNWIPSARLKQLPSCILLMGPLVFSAVCLGASASEGLLTAGAGRVDITPAANAIPRPYDSVLDHIYARAIVIDNGQTRAALLNADVGGISTATYERVAHALTKELRIPLDNIIISATHDHSAPFGAGGPTGRAPEKNAQKFEEGEVNGLTEAARIAIGRLQPAKIGYATTNLFLNVNRDAIDPTTRLWTSANNTEFPSDKTLAVVELSSMDNKPIAAYVNYAMHAVLLFLSPTISGDFPGATERYLEREYGGDFVAIWSSGAAGDQSPLFQRPNTVIFNAKVQAVMDKDNLALGPAIMRAMFAGSEAEKAAGIERKYVEESRELVRSTGQIMAEAVIQVMDPVYAFSNDHPHIRNFSSSVSIVGQTKTVTCAGRNRTDTTREGSPGTYTDGEPVNIKVGSLRIGTIAFGTVDGEIYSKIGQRAKEESVLRDTLIVTLANGMANSGYIPSDDAFGRYTFQILGSRLKPGCAENGIVHAIDDMILEETTH
jgi:neutral ceramidase